MSKEEKVQIKSTKCAHNHCDCNHEHDHVHNCNCNSEHDENCHDKNCHCHDDKKADIVVEKYVIPADEAPVTQEDVNKMEAEFANKPVLSIEEIETALTKVTGNFTFNDFCELIPVLKQDKDGTLKRRVQRLLDGDCRLFDDQKGNYIKREDFFMGFEFLITPDAWEISQGYIFPGHRFAGIFTDDIFPSDVKFISPLNEETPTYQVDISLGKIFRYHLLLGSEQLFEYFIADDESNSHLKKSVNNDSNVKVTVFDLQKFFKVCKFEEGDAIKCKVLDYKNGIVSYTYLSAEDRLYNTFKEYTQTFDGALTKVFERFEDYPDIPEQLTWALYYSGRNSAPISFEEYLRTTTAMAISAEGDHSIFAPVNISETGSVSLPEGISVSGGETKDASVILKEIGSSLTMTEIDSFILDSCYARELEFEPFFNKLFGRKHAYADEAQEVIWKNFLEERFEELTTNYNRYDDEIKAPLRTTILELIEDRLDFLGQIADLGISLGEKATDYLKQMAAISLQLNEILKQLNNPAYTPTAEELEPVEKIVENRTDDLEKLFDYLDNHLEELKK
jgi:hypothetical protein